MSNPTSDPEVENVLSSIRRLIVEGRPETTPAEVTPPGRLVLIPSLRVEEAAAPPPPPAPDGPAALGHAPLVLAPGQLRSPSSSLASPLGSADRGAVQEAPPLVTAGDWPSSGSVTTSETGLDASGEPGGPDIANEPALGENLLNGGADEAALRALIAEVVREELRGEFGERVTRNLRKLVRQELLRVLAARDGA